MSVKSGAYQYAVLQQPAAMAEDGHLATNWREWKTAFDCYMIATGKEKAESREKCALFLHIIGKYGREILEEIDIDESDKTNYNTLISKFTLHCDPSRNINYERHIFFETHQEEGTFDKFLRSLKLRSKSCEFGQLRNSLIVTQIIRGIKDGSMRERMLAKTKLDLEEAVSWCRAVETANKQAEACAAPAARASPEAAVDALRAGSARHGSGGIGAGPAAATATGLSRIQCAYGL